MTRTTTKWFYQHHPRQHNICWGVIWCD